jgi:hypothetical protein
MSQKNGDTAQEKSKETDCGDPVRDADEGRNPGIPWESRLFALVLRELRKCRKARVSANVIECHISLALSLEVWKGDQW